MTHLRLCFSPGRLVPKIIGMNVPELKEVIAELIAEQLKSRGREQEDVKQTVEKFSGDTVQSLAEAGELATYLQMSREDAKTKLAGLIRTV